MFETDAELDRLQALLNGSFERASAQLLSIMTPERRLTAARLVAELPAPAVLAVASVTRAGEPRISAVDGHFLHGCWHFSAEASSSKARQLAARPAVSAAYTPRDGYGVFCHGRVRFLAPGSERQELREHLIATYGQDPQEWGDEIAYLRIEPSWMTGFAMPEPAGDGPPA